MFSSSTRAIIRFLRAGLDPQATRTPYPTVVKTDARFRDRIAEYLA
jgi:hypothetical protein